MIILNPPLYIKDKNIHLSLLLPLTIHVEQHDEIIVLSNPKLNIYALVNENENLFAELIAELLFEWREYALEKDENMTKDAIELKCTLLKCFKSIPSLPETRGK